MRQKGCGLLFVIKPNWMSTKFAVWWRFKNCVCTWYSASSKYWTLSYLSAFLRRLMFQFKRQTSLANNVSATSLSLFDKNADGKSIKIIRLLKRTPRTNWVRLAGVKLSNLVFYWTSHKWYSTHRGFMSLEPWNGAPLCLEMVAKLLFQFGTQYTFMTNDYKKCRFLLSICTSGFWWYYKRFIQVMAQIAVRDFKPS